jgi:hypothetical protein
VVSMSLAALLLLWRFAVIQDPADALLGPALEGVDQAWIQQAIPARRAPLAELGRQPQSWVVPDSGSSGINRIESRPRRITK